MYMLVLSQTIVKYLYIVMYFVEINVSNVEINVWMFHRQRLPGAPQAVPANSPGTAQSAGLFPAAAHRFSRVFVPGSAHLRSHPCHRCVRFILLPEKLSVAYIMAWQFKSVNDNNKKLFYVLIIYSYKLSDVFVSGFAHFRSHTCDRCVYLHFYLATAAAVADLTKNFSFYQSKGHSN